MTIVVGYVPTPEGLAAVDHAVEMARLKGSRVVVVNTGRDGSYAHSDFASAQDLDALAGRLGPDHEVRQPTAGRGPAEEILDAAKQTDAELIVIGLRRRSPVGKLIMGSTAQQVLLQASCPVLAVKV